jgi:hypothetical protein
MYASVLSSESAALDSVDAAPTKLSGTRPGKTGGCQINNMSSGTLLVLGVNRGDTAPTKSEILESFDFEIAPRGFIRDDGPNQDYYGLLVSGEGDVVFKELEGRIEPAFGSVGGGSSSSAGSKYDAPETEDATEVGVDIAVPEGYVGLLIINPGTSNSTLHAMVNGTPTPGVATVHIARGSSQFIEANGQDVTVCNDGVSTTSFTYQLVS